MARKPFVNLEKKRYGRLRVLERLPNKKNERVYYLCECDCGKQWPVSHGNLQQWRTISCQQCGANRRAENMRKNTDRRQIGQRYGSLTVIKRARDKTKWVCECRLCESRCELDRTGLRSVAAARRAGCRYCRQSRGEVLAVVGERELRYQEVMSLLGVTRQRVYQLRDSGMIQARVEQAVAKRVEKERKVKPRIKSLSKNYRSTVAA